MNDQNRDDDALVETIRFVAKERSALPDDPRVVQLAAVPPALEDKLFSIAVEGLVGASPVQRISPSSGASPLAVVRAKRRTLAFVAIPSVLALAASVFLTVMPTQRLVELPAYELEIVASDKTSRSGGEMHADETPRLRADSILDLVIRPLAPSRGSIGIALFAVRDNDARRIDVHPEISDLGGYRIVGRRDVILKGMPAGLWELVAVIGSTSALTRAERSLREGASPETNEVRVVRQRVDLVDVKEED